MFQGSRLKIFDSELTIMPRYIIDPTAQCRMQVEIFRPDGCVCMSASFEYSRRTRISGDSESKKQNGQI